MFNMVHFLTEEEEEEEIAPPQPADETQVEKPDQKEEEEGTPLPVMIHNCNTLLTLSLSSSCIGTLL